MSGELGDRARDPVDVAIAILRSDQGILVRRRRPDERLPGTWEFPGGKVLPEETDEEAAIREVKEEMGVEATGLKLLSVIEHDYEDRRVRIAVFEGACIGTPVTPDGAEWLWVRPAELASLPVPPANRELVKRLARSDSNRSG